jgi:hypothetical protein
LSVESAICDPRAIVRKVAEVFRKSAVFNNYEQAASYAALKRVPGVLQGPAQPGHRRAKCAS